jgi:hypothetical protein
VLLSPRNTVNITKIAFAAALAILSPYDEILATPLAIPFKSVMKAFSWVQNLHLAVRLPSETVHCLYANSTISGTYKASLEAAMFFNHEIRVMNYISASDPEY